ncbi:mannonate dehydratase [Dysgonomonas termitidis]|uniref:Mannonate dehydratase n=1 Tax=Dysgonomonas termitidis TaxID=1516126 RepID=A0ABV9L100_9BACT
MALEKTWRWFGANDSVTLSDLKQIGIEGIVTSLHHIPNGEIWTKEEIMKVKNEIESYGMRWSVVESLPVLEGIKTCSAGRGRLIDNYKESLRNLGECGIDTVCYNFMPVLDWARTDLHYKDKNGAESMLFDYCVFAAFDIYVLRRPMAAKDYPEDVREKAGALAANMSDEEKETLAHNIIVVTQGFINGTVSDVEDYKQLFLSYLEQYKYISPEQLRKNLSAFLSDIMPIAEEYGVNMCIHPDDPPFPLLGLPRIASTLEDFKWITGQYDSVMNGITFCTGSLSAREDNDMLKFIKELGSRIHFVHLRNTRRLGNKSFYESGHLEGSIDMYEVVKALLEEQKRRIQEGRKDIRMPFRPDHGLRILDDFSRKANPGYPLVGRMKGLAEICGLEMGIEKSKQVP